MKRTLAMLLAVLLLVAVVPASAFASGTKTVYVSRNGSGTLNLREGPGYDYDVTGHYVYHNSKVTVLKTSGKWSKVKAKSSGHVGWIRTYYIDGTTKALGTGTHVIKSETKLYRKASSSSSKKATLYKGDTVKVYETSHDYARVTVTGSGKTGWVKMSAIGGTTSTKAESSSGSTVYRTTATHGLWLHTTANDKTSTRIRLLKKGTAFTVIKTSGDWYKIRTLDAYNQYSSTGWVFKKYTAKTATAKVCTNTDPLRVRKSPSSSAAVLGYLKKGTTATVKKASGSWAYVVKGSLEGWAYLDHLKF